MMPGAGRRALLLAALPLLAAQAPPVFIEISPGAGAEPVWIAAEQVVRIGQAEGFTVLDTTAWVQQRTVEPIESVARRVAATGRRLLPLTDLNGRRVYLSADRVVLVRESQERHAAGARAAIVMVGLRFNTDVAVRETPGEVMAALQRAAEGR